MHQESLLSEEFCSHPYQHRNGFQIGSVAVQLCGNHSSDVALMPSMEPFRFLSQNPDIDVRVEWLPSISRLPVGQTFDSGSIWHLSVEEHGYRFDFNVPFLGTRPYRRLLIDFSFSESVLQMSRESYAAVPYRPDPLEYPLDELLIMHRLTQEKAIELHGTGIARSNGEANLFIGHSGAGKSTTTRLWTEVEDVEVLSDDRIIVRHDRSSPTCMRMYGTPWHGEAMFASPDSAPLTRVFVLEHGHGNVIERLTSSQAVAELFARSFVPFHRHQYVDSALAFLEQLANAVPVYRYAFEPDQRAVEKIRNFHD